MFAFFSTSLFEDTAVGLFTFIALKTLTQGETYRLQTYEDFVKEKKMPVSRKRHLPLSDVELLSKKSKPALNAE